MCILTQEGPVTSPWGCCYKFNYVQSKSIGLFMLEEIIFLWYSKNVKWLIMLFEISNLNKRFYCKGLLLSIGINIILLHYILWPFYYNTVVRTWSQHALIIGMNVMVVLVLKWFLWTVTHEYIFNDFKKLELGEQVWIYFRFSLRLKSIIYILYILNCANCSTVSLNLTRWTPISSSLRMMVDNSW